MVARSAESETVDEEKTTPLLRSDAASRVVTTFVFLASNLAFNSSSRQERAVSKPVLELRRVEPRRAASRRVCFYGKRDEG